jgi:hypothetical protein
LCRISLIKLILWLKLSIKGVNIHILLSTVMRYIPTPIPIKYDFVYTATANKSGRMQYHKVRPGYSRVRLSRTEYIKAFNDSTILAVRPLQLKGDELLFQLEFYV